MNNSQNLPNKLVSSFTSISKIIFYIFFAFFFFICQPKLLIAQKDIKKHRKIDFSANYEVHIININIEGAKYIDYQFLEKHIDLYANETYWLWELEKKVETLRTSGYIHKKKFKYFLTKLKGQDTYDLILQIHENPIISKIEIINHTDIDGDLLYDFFEENHFGKGIIANKKNYDTAIQKYLAYYQKKGTFLIKIYYELVKSQNLDGIHLKVTIEPIKILKVNFIKVIGSKYFSFRKILDNLNFTFNDTITDNDVLDDSYIKIKRLGVFSSVFFKFEKVGSKKKKKTDSKKRKKKKKLTKKKKREVSNKKGKKKKNKKKKKKKLIEESYKTEWATNKINQNTHLYFVKIFVKELKVEEIFTSTQFRDEIGPIFIVKYINFNVGGKGNRVTAQLGYEGDLNTVNFILEFTAPEILKNTFFSTRLQKQDSVLNISSNVNKLSELFSFRLTTGYRFFDFFSGFVFFQENFYKESTVDNKRNSIATPSTVALKDNVFESNPGLFLIYNSLNDIFNPNRGIRTIISYDIIPKIQPSQTIQSQTDLYFAVSRSLVIGFFLKGAYLITKDSDTTLFPYSNRRSNAQIRDESRVKASLFSSLETRFATRFITEDSYFVVFLETGGLWSAFNKINAGDLGYGAGIGFRWAPSKYNYSFLFGFPGSINIGIKLSKNGYKSPNFSLLEHRDQYYYVNLTGGF